MDIFTESWDGEILFKHLCRQQVGTEGGWQICMLTAADGLVHEYALGIPLGTPGEKWQGNEVLLWDGHLCFTLIAETFTEVETPGQSMLIRPHTKDTTGDFGKILIGSLVMH